MKECAQVLIVQAAQGVLQGKQTGDRRQVQAAQHRGNSERQGCRERKCVWAEGGVFRGAGCAV